MVASRVSGSATSVCPQNRSLSTPMGSRMRSSAVVKFEIPADRISRLSNAFIGPQIHLLVLDAAPQPLDEDVIPPSPFAVHADGDGVAGEHAGECRAGELRALVGVEYLRLAVTSQGILQGLDAEGSFHRDRQPPRQTRRVAQSSTTAR